MRIPPFEHFIIKFHLSILTKHTYKINYEGDKIKELRIFNFFNNFQTNRKIEMFGKDYYRKKFIFNHEFFDYETNVYEQLCEKNDKMVIVDNNKSENETVEQIEKELENHKILLKRR